MQDVVYAFKPAEDAVVSISLCGSSYDTALAIFSRSNDWADLVEAACNDDYCSAQSYLQASPITWRSWLTFRHISKHDGQAERLCAAHVGFNGERRYILHCGVWFWGSLGRLSAECHSCRWQHCQMPAYQGQLCCGPSRKHRSCIGQW